MKKFFLILLLFPLLSFHLVYAQSSSGIEIPAEHRNIFISVGGGIGFPNLQGYKKGFGFQLDGGFYISRKIGFRADVHAEFINREDEIYRYPDGTSEKVTGRDMNMYTLKVNVLYGNFDVSSIVNPYILIGAGIGEKKFSSRIYEETFFSYFTNSDSTLKTVNGAYWKTDFAAGIGAGINVKISKKLKINGELQYMIMDGLTMDDKILSGSLAHFKAGILFLL